MENKNQVAVTDLFEAGFQYGHKSIKSSPKMKRYIHDVRWGISIIDLSQTAPMFARALDSLFNIVKKGGSVLFVGTKYQAKDLILKHAKECNQYYINKRWLGGSLTNYSCTIANKVKQLEEIERLEDLGMISKYGKKEQLKIAEKKSKLLSLIDGVRSMIKLPDLLIVVDAKKEHIALSEAKIAGIPTIVLADTDTKDPAICSNVVPGNDDGHSSIEFFLQKCQEVITLALSQVDKKNDKPIIKEKALSEGTES